MSDSMINDFNLFLPSYKIIKKLSTNYIGGRNTYLAIDSITQQQVIIKQFEFARQGNEWSGYKQLEREIEYLQMVSHPQVCKYIDTVESETGLCLVTQYIDGTALEYRSVTTEQAVAIALDVLDIPILRTLKRKSFLGVLISRLGITQNIKWQSIL